MLLQAFFAAGCGCVLPIFCLLPSYDFNFNNFNLRAVKFVFPSCAFNCLLAMLVCAFNDDNFMFVLPKPGRVLGMLFQAERMPTAAFNFGNFDADNCLLHN